MNKLRGISLALLGLALLVAPQAHAQEANQKVKDGQAVDVPFIFWGGDVATFHANGGLETTAGSIYGKQGLKCRLTPGDDFDKQVENYLTGKSPFLRGTMSMLGQASDKLIAKAETTPVVFLQLTWSAGDHLVGRQELKTLDQLKGKKIALQEGGPHVGMLNDILQTARLGWKDITVVWTKDVSGDKGPAELFRKDKSVDACFAISPEMFELSSAPESGGIDSTGNGTKKSVKGAHVVISTQHLSRSIADVYACRKDFYDANRDWIDKFTAGYLKGCEELVDVKKRGADDKDPTQKDSKKRYSEIIKLAQGIWGKDPAFKDAVAKEDDVDGLISDANFVGLPGNEAFFKTKGNLSGFDFKQKQALKLPGDPSKDALKTNPKLFDAADFDYDKLRKLGDLHGVAPDAERFRDVALGKNDDIVYSFEITFKPNESVFPEATYGEHFQRALELASLYGNTVVAVRGHADAIIVAQKLKDAGLIKTKDDKDKGYTVVATGKEYEPRQTDAILELVKDNPKLELKLETDFLQGLSEKRGEAVQKAVLGYAGNHALRLDKSQFRATGQGMREPRTSVWEVNRRVEFSIIKVAIDKLNPEEFRLVK